MQNFPAQETPTKSTKSHYNNFRRYSCVVIWLYVNVVACPAITTAGYTQENFIRGLGLVFPSSTAKPFRLGVQEEHTVSPHGRLHSPDRERACFFPVSFDICNKNTLLSIC